MTENKFDKDMLITEYLGKGIYRFNAHEVLKDFDHECFLPRNRPYAEPEHLNIAKRLDEYNVYQINQLRELQNRISKEYLSEFRHHIFYHDFYDTVYPTSENRHYDIEDVLGWNGYNAVLNCYFEDTFEENNDTAVTATPYSDEILGTKKDLGTENIYVKKHDIVLINQTRHFLHRVTGIKQKRPILMFVVSFMDFHAKERTD